MEEDMASGFEHDKLSEEVIGAVIRVHQELGPGFTEKVYKRALIVESRESDLPFEVEKHIFIYYKGTKIGRQVLDLVVANEIVIELKVAEGLSKAHYAQLRSYLKASKIKTGLLVNFAAERADFRRIQL